MLDRKKQRAERLKTLCFQAQLFENCQVCEKRDKSSVEPCAGCPIFHALNQVEGALENIKKFGIECYQVKEFPVYYVDREGNVYSNLLQGSATARATTLRRLKKRRSLRAHGVQLTGGVQKNVHKLVYEAIYGPVGKSEIIVHKNNDNFDNRLSNLATTTRSAHAKGKKRTDKYKRSEIKALKERMAEIEKFKKSMTWAEVATKYGVNPTTLRKNIYQYRKGKLV